MHPAIDLNQTDKDSHTLALDIAAESVREELGKILASPGFVTADRLSRFLRYAVEEQLNGQTDKLKESILGVEVFSRKPTYDPRIDAVVRTEAVKLRARLKAYYESHGREDAIIIDIPKGGYVPVFREREREPLAAPAPLHSSPLLKTPARRTIWLKLAIVAASVLLASGLAIIGSGDRFWTAQAASPEVSTIAVLPFVDLSPDGNLAYFCDGMTEELIDSLTKISGFRVAARTSSSAFKGTNQDIRDIAKKLNVGYVLEGSVRKDGHVVRVTAQLNNAADGYQLWSETYERQLNDVFAIEDEISKAIAGALKSIRK